MLDDHDQVWKGSLKGRFCSDSLGSSLIFPALALNLTTLGIPCIYYGTEQFFDGSGGDGLPGHGADQWIREAMFGGKFGAFRSQDRHFFREEGMHPEIARLARLRKEHLPLTRGRQYLREISADGVGFGYPFKMGQGRMQSIIAWSRIFNNVEILCAISTDVERERTVWVTIDGEINQGGDELLPLYGGGSSGHSASALVVQKKSGRSVVELTVPPAGFVMYKK
jgi:hypothetical protein